TRLRNTTFNVATTTGSTTGANSQATGTVASANPFGGTTNFGMGPIGDGWHNLEIRMGNGTGGGGGVARTAGAGAPNWLTIFGLGLRDNTTNLTSVDAADYVIPVDPGNSSLFRTVQGGLSTAGAGRLVLTGANTYSGVTLVNGGELF